MRRQAICNLLTTLSYPPWTKDPSRVVYMTLDGEERIPFYAYVQPSNNCTAAAYHGATLFQFGLLPEEVQLYILAMCPVSTLFQLMHVSSRLRIEASKLFWAKRDACFLIEAQWLVDGAFSGDSFWDMDFLIYIQNLEIEYRPALSQTICLERDDTLEIQSDLIATFWASLTKRFPNVKRIILNHNDGSTSWRDAKEIFPLAVQLLLQACPQDIECSVLFLEKKQTPQNTAATSSWRTATYQRCLFQQAEMGAWEKSGPDRARRTILMPPKQFTGPVGSFRKLVYQCYKEIPLRRFGLWPLMVEAIDRYFMDTGRDKSFLCPFFNCTVSFSQAGEWTIHAAEAHYQEWIKLIEIVPNSSVGNRLKDCNQALDEETAKVQDQFKAIKYAWSSGDDARQGEIQRAWMEQLDSDLAWQTEEKGEKSTRWLEFIQYMRPE